LTSFDLKFARNIIHLIKRYFEENNNSLTSNFYEYCFEKEKSLLRKFNKNLSHPERRSRGYDLLKKSGSVTTQCKQLNNLDTSKYNIISLTSLLNFSLFHQLNEKILSYGISFNFHEVDKKKSIQLLDTNLKLLKKNNKLKDPSRVGISEQYFFHNVGMSQDEQQRHKKLLIIQKKLEKYDQAINDDQQYNDTIEKIKKKKKYSKKKLLKRKRTKQIIKTKEQLEEEQKKLLQNLPLPIIPSFQQIIEQVKKRIFFFFFLFFLLLFLF
jgi:hypothetical protein